MWRSSLVPIEAVGSGFSFRARGTDVRRARFRPLGRAFDGLSKPGTRDTRSTIGGSLGRSRRIFPPSRPFQAPPWAWFLIVFGRDPPFLLHQTGSLGWGKGLALICRCRGSRSADRRIWPEPRKSAGHPINRVDYGYGPQAYIEVKQDLSSKLWSHSRRKAAPYFPSSICCSDTAAAPPFSRCTGDRSGFGQ